MAIYNKQRLSIIKLMLKLLLKINSMKMNSIKLRKCF